MKSMPIMFHVHEFWHTIQYTMIWEPCLPGDKPCMSLCALIIDVRSCMCLQWFEFPTNTDG